MSVKGDLNRQQDRRIYRLDFYACKVYFYPKEGNIHKDSITRYIMLKKLSHILYGIRLIATWTLIVLALLEGYYLVGNSVYMPLPVMLYQVKLSIASIPISVRCSRYQSTVRT